MRQLALPVRLRATSVFESFLAGSNADAVRQLRSLAPGDRPPAIWLYGPHNAGKTHLLQAVCAMATKRGHSSAYLPLREVGTREATLLDGFESLDILCLDDVDAIAGSAAWERACFNLYRELEERGGRLLVATQSSPAATPIALRDLASRLAAGAVLRLQLLDDAEQIAALTLRATQLGLELPADTAHYLIRHLPRDMTQLCGVLETLDHASLATQRRLTVPFVKQVLDKA